MSSPSSGISPPVGSKSPATMLTVVGLAEPFGPRLPSTQTRRAVKLMLQIAVNAP